jgi:hypothetical protein
VRGQRVADRDIDGNAHVRSAVIGATSSGVTTVRQAASE